MILSKRKSPVKRLILCDFDGTITREDVGYGFFNKFTKESWEKIDQDYIGGKIGSREAYTKIAELIVCSEEEIVHFVRQNSLIDPYFKEFYEFLGDEGIDFKIVSDGFSFYINALLAHHGMSGIEHFANTISFKKDKTEVAFPFYNPECGSCGNCKRSIFKRFRSQYAHIIFIGNGFSDRCIAEEADEVYAKTNLYTHCIEKGITCWTYSNFLDIKKNLSKNVRGIIFDLDGTLIDSVEAIHECFDYALGYFGCRPIGADELQALSRSSIKNVMSQLVDSRSLSDAMKLFKKKYLELIVDAPPLFSDVKLVLSTLKNAGFVLGIATNMERKYAINVLRQSNIEQYFTVVIGADDPGRLKPRPDLINDALKDMEIHNEDAIFVGDSAIDIETGKNAGIDVYAVPTGFETKKSLSQMKPRRILNRLKDLIT